MYNWMMPLCHRKSKFIIHNNLDRRLAVLLKFRYFQKRLLSLCKAQYNILPNSHYIGHPVPEVDKIDIVKDIIFVVSDDPVWIETTLSDPLLSEYTHIVKGKFHTEYVEDLVTVLQKSHVMFIDRQYSQRVSSLIAMAIGYGAGVVVKDIGTLINMRSTFNTKRVALSFDSIERNENYLRSNIFINEAFKNNVSRFISA
jgi:hypothetical protein